MSKYNAEELKTLNELLSYSDRYEITIQFWPNLTAVFIVKDGVDLADFGNSSDAIERAIEYLKRITKPQDQ